MRDFGASFVPAAIGAMAIAAALAGVIGLITLRLKGAYFAIVSWGVASVAVVIVNSWTPVTGGALGFYGTPTAQIAGLSMSNPRNYAWITGAILVLLVVVIAAIRRTSFGRRLNGGRVNNNLIRATGAHIYLDRVIAFTVSAGLAALAGALAVSYVRVLTPNMLGFTVTVDALVMVLLGGTGFLLGPVIGAALIRIIPEQMHVSPEARTMIVAALILAIVLLAPGGIPDVIRRLKGLWRRRKEPASDPQESAELTRPVEEVKQ
jgi:branched-chain amino acid transport system permease protein